MSEHIRKAGYADVKEIMAIIAQGAAFLKQQGLPQWQDGHAPGQNDIEQDIKREEGYVLICDEKVSGYTALIGGIDEIYTNITEGQWNSTYDRYVSVHRVAVDTTIRGRGLGKKFMQLLAEEARKLGYHDVRIDTHPDNLVMHNVILKSGYIYRGMVQFPIPHGERKAYQLLID